ncbi:hypothetical protein ACBI99_14070 [Nonomuraea sp. ATR24]|uniref:hypothetical protein n=1 Tax=Nonomuraea TaxID=83681 RepID=UPI001C5CF0E1|nr:hypothetical protein [Nonomuraea ceibae]
MTAQTVAPRRSRRQAPRRRGAGAVLLSTLAGIVLAAGAVGVQSLRLSVEETGAPLTYAGAKGEMVDAGRFSVRVRDVTTARTVRNQDEAVTAEQVFLVVEAEATVPKEPLHLGPAVLLAADGKKYTATDKVDKMATLAYPWIQPGWTTSGRFVFEVPASALEGAQVVFRLPIAGLYVEPMPPEAQIDLGIDAATAKKLSSAPADVVDLGEKK